ncbi:MAG: alpha/beta hydrolase [Bacteroidales bacterium]|jgi:pimeloyl-ACP methyl ester carboxylesterase|nr:alpha/beta hydrolase [Bacteroidales bacterium]HOI32035.1 alpha/beta hydrolase [Bacteroidales bacterium]
MKTITYNQKQIAYHQAGAGQCLMLVHGFPMDSRVWQNFITALAEHFCVLVPDLPGFGQSEMLAERHDMSLMADVLAAILKAEKISKCVFAGHSMGGYVGLAFAAAYPEMLRGLALLHSQAAADDENTREQRNQNILKVSKDKKTYLEGFVDGLFDPDFLKQNPQSAGYIKDITQSQDEKAIVAALAGMRERESHIELLTHIKAPVLFVLGKSDSRMPLVKIMAQTVLPAHGELLMLKGVGHMGFLEAPQIVQHTLQSFTERCYLT